MASKILYVDMDDVIADFYKATKNEDGTVQEEKMFDKNFFLNLDPVPGAKKGVFELEKMGFDVWILSQPFVLVPESYIEKAQWVQLHFPRLYNKLILTQDKGLNVGDYLIDDNFKKWEQKFIKNGGKFVHFQYGGYNHPNSVNPQWVWDEVVRFFQRESPHKG